MKDFTIWLNSKKAKELYPVLLSGLKITTKECQKIFNVSERTARGYLSELVKKDLIKAVGPQKGRYYTLI